ncbi:MAG: hypothetical protein C0463_08195, partial [Idiomarina sp.]|nr:hypothetical protein [Idiomarina sp.]
RTALHISHPGNSLARLMARLDNDVTNETLLEFIERPQLEGLLKGEVSVNQNLARALKSATGVSAEYWVSRQRDYDHQTALHVHSEHL